MSTNFVFVLDTNRKPLAPCKPGVARSLLKAGKAKVFRRYPFTIILNKQINSQLKTLQLKIEPGSKQTGFALLTQGREVIWAMVLTHQGQQIKDALERLSVIRRACRSHRTSPTNSSW